MEETSGGDLGNESPGQVVGIPPASSQQMCQGQGGEPSLPSFDYGGPLLSRMLQLLISAFWI